jgi:hypothetical protein
MEWWTVAVVFAVACSGAAAEGPLYPGKKWQTRTPAQARLDPARLDALRDFAGGHGCVVRHGAMAYAWGNSARRADVASAAKPWYAHFLFKAIEDGQIAGLDERVVRVEPRLKDLNPDLGHKDRSITWRHLATQTSCYGVAEAPGAAFDYNDWQMALFWDTLFLKSYGASLQTVDERVLHAGLTDLLQCEDDPTFLAFGHQDRPGRLAVSPRDFCRFGLLYLREGNWNGKQLISRRHARLAVSSPLPNSLPRTSGKPAAMIPGQRTIGSTRIPDDQTDHLGSYSFLWWTNGGDREGKRHWADAPTDAYGAFGHGGRRAMVVIPGLDLVASWNDTRIEGREMENAALKLLVEADRAPS